MKLITAFLKAVLNTLLAIYIRAIQSPRVGKITQMLPNLKIMSTIDFITFCATF
jgi:hypothetical protein